MALLLNSLNGRLVVAMLCMYRVYDSKKKNARLKKALASLARTCYTSQRRNGVLKRASTCGMELMRPGYDQKKTLSNEFSFNLCLHQLQQARQQQDARLYDLCADCCVRRCRRPLPQLQSKQVQNFVRRSSPGQSIYASLFFTSSSNN